jgi:hypothetical protein
VTRPQLLVGAGLVIVAGGVAGAVVLVFGGGSGSLTPAQYLARADAACRPYGRQLDHVAPPDPGSTADVAASVGRALPILQHQADAVRRIRVPRQLEQRVRRFFTLTDRSLAALRTVLDAAKRDDAKAMGPRLGAWFVASEDAQAASKQVGFHC